MANMSYCRFENTLADLWDCYKNMEADMSDDESDAKKDLIALCKVIAEEYGE